MEQSVKIQQGVLLPSQLEALAKAVAWMSLCLALVGIPALGWKLGVVGFAVTLFLLAVFSLPVHQSIAMFFTYLLFDGALKILSNYHPVVHVGQDLYLLALFARVVAGSSGWMQSWQKTPFFILITMFFASVFLQYLNPFGLGLLPSIAGTKVYTSGILLFFLVYHYMRPGRINGFFTWVVILGTAQCVAACVEYLFFPEQIFALHPKYKLLAAEKFVDQYYRPFGFTSAPGAPSIWVFLCAPMAYYLLLESRSYRVKALSLFFFSVGIPTMVFCQTRASALLFALTVLGAMFAPNGRKAPKIFGLCLMLVAAVPFVNSGYRSEGFATFAAKAGIDESKAEALNARFLSLLETSTYGNARQGAFGQMIALASQMPWGIGLSRVGAASAVWKEQIERDPYLGKNWAFADNVYRAIFTELGIPGLFLWLILTVSIAFKIVRKSFSSAVSRRSTLLWICGIAPLVVLVGGLGSEGILYMPVAAFFWTFLAIGLRESSHV